MNIWDVKWYRLFIETIVRAHKGGHIVTPTQVEMDYGNVSKRYDKFISIIQVNKYKQQQELQRVHARVSYPYTWWRNV